MHNTPSADTANHVLKSYRKGSARWPQQLWIVRHGQSAGNLARDAAESAKHFEIHLRTRDIDTPLSTLGEQQSAALGKWFGSLAEQEQPTVVLSSPYLRAQETVRHLLKTAQLDQKKFRLQIDERLREKEFGIFDRLTRFGIAEHHPDLLEKLRQVGKFYFRPPGGESWCDVILRLRSLFDHIGRDYTHERVLIVAHQVIVYCIRYLVEQLDESQLLAIDRAGDVPNCGVCVYRYTVEEEKMTPQLINFVAPLLDMGTPVTTAPDLPGATEP